MDILNNLSSKTFAFIESFNPNHFGIFVSLAIHLLILVIAIGIPNFFQSKPIILPNIIPIEILNISETTNLEKKSIKKTNEIIKNKNLEQKKFNASNNTEIKKIDLQEKPVKTKEIFTQKNDLIKNLDTKQIDLKENKITKIKELKPIEPLEQVETIKVQKIKPKLKPKPKKTILNKSSDVQRNNKIELEKKSAKENTTSKLEPKPKPDPDLSMASMLKDLRNEKSNLSEVLDEKNIEKVDEDNKKNQESINNELSISQLDLVLQQLRGCFNPRAGTKIVGDEMVKISAKIDRNGFVKKDTIQISDTNISKGNPYYKPITESAMATLYNPSCSQLKLPLDKYESWKNLTITIDYSWISN
ncbi:MAG: hypothetical protein CMI96_02360 [Pelagibacteraceae bacterium]|nr:hypothetical protein [Pelagibacteraceae bacterium]|tara:strand:+ start:16976 stop:18052 length:1077 start_codon:yes stop_codon:yes gene_type:complete